MAFRDRSARAGGGRLLAGAVLALWAGCGRPAAEPPGSARPAREAKAGEVHAVSVALGAGSHLHATVELLGIDVTVTVVGPGREELARVDGPGDWRGTETALVKARREGLYRVEVTARTPGAFRLAVEELPAATPTERRRIAAGLAVTAASQLYAQGTATARRQALALYRQALEHWQAAGEPGETARLLLYLGVIHGDLGEARAARERLSQALAAFQVAADRHGEADALNQLGYLRWSQGEHEEAAGFYRRALALRRGLGDRCAQAQSLSNLGLVDHHRGEPRRALASYRAALVLCGGRRRPDLEATLRVNVGGAHEVMGELDEALRSYAAALPILRDRGLSQVEAATLNNLGAAHRALGEIQPALERYGQALEIFDRLGDRRGEATALNSLGLAYLSLGELQTAKGLLERAAALRREVGDRRGEAATLNNLGLVQERLGEARAALDHYRAALALRRDSGDRRGEGTTLAHLGALYRQRGQLARARRVLGRALALHRDVGDPSREARTLREMARVHRALGESRLARASLVRARELSRRIRDRTGEAETLAALAGELRHAGELAGARAHLEQALALLESLRTAIYSPDLRAAFSAQQRSVYEQAIDLRMELHRREPSRGHDRAALELSERARARTFVELLREAGAQILQGGDAGLLTRQRALERRLATRALRLQELLAREPGAAEAAALEEESRGLLRRLDRIEAEIRRQSPGYAALIRPEAPGALAMQRLLDPGTLLLHYALGEERSFLWAVSAEGIETFVLPPRGRIEDRARRLYELWSTLDSRGREEEAWQAAALSRLLLGPVADRLQRVARLVVVADGALHYLPFAALPVPATARPLAGESTAGDSTAAGEGPLVAGREIVHLPSAAVLELQRRTLGRRAPAPRAVAVLADAVYTATDPRLPARPLASSGDSEAWPRLPWSRREAAAIAALVPADGLLLALGPRASLATVTSGVLQDYRIVHFGTHGVLAGEEPRLSGLMLSRFDAAGRRREGFLSLRDVYGLRLRADLVVLSGCRTALGKEVRGEGLVGLTRGFMYSGAARVIASLWQVEDAATAELMARFYRALLRQGRPPAAALREAQAALAATPLYRDPYYWAGFILQGDWERWPGSS